MFMGLVIFHVGNAFASGALGLLVGELPFTFRDILRKAHTVWWPRCLPLRHCPLAFTPSLHKWGFFPLQACDVLFTFKGIDPILVVGPAPAYPSCFNLNLASWEEPALLFLSRLIPSSVYTYSHCVHTICRFMFFISLSKPPEGKNMFFVDHSITLVPGTRST